MQSPRGGLFSRVSQGFGFGKTSKNNQRDSAPTSATSEVSTKRQACIQPRTLFLRQRLHRLTSTVDCQISRVLLTCKQRLTLVRHLRRYATLSSWPDLTRLASTPQLAGVPELRVGLSRKYCTFRLVGHPLVVGDMMTMRMRIQLLKRSNPLWFKGRSKPRSRRAQKAPRSVEHLHVTQHPNHVRSQCSTVKEVLRHLTAVLLLTGCW